ncbi:MAG TPA: methylated-DNA--[protein]-cysteine S-methyltransferase [Solirubrobacteraceae bacterium]|nr:methylated-DNA--[protein]-cysteine S-methyltransferase [Solirubrobacteraceae bacterium]
MLYSIISTPIGPLMLRGDTRALTGLHLPGRHPATDGLLLDDERFADEARQLAEYFDGTRRSFEIALRAAGGAFQCRVWAELERIPYGETASYGEIARRLGAPAASRAVGAANGRNPIAIVVPCHRVIGGSGSLTGYGCGLECKRALLDLEAGRAALV